MRYFVTGLAVALTAVVMWGADSPVYAQTDCVSLGAVSSSEPALAADCEILLDIRNVLLGTATLDRSADIPADITIDDWEEFRHTLEEAALRNITTDPPLEAKHYYERPPSLNWAAGLPIEDWDGITVDGTPRRVVGISLSYERLPGRVPKGLGNLTGLKRVHLDGNELGGPVPSELGNLSNLTSLHLDGNELGGPVPSELGNLSSLTSLRLDGNKLRGTIPAQLGGLSNLTELFVDSNRLTGEIPGSFTNLANLTYFRFWGNEGLCTPTDEAFRAWLQAIDYVAGPACDFAADRAVLVKLFDSTDGPNWLRSYGWLSDLPMGEWHGVQTDDEGRVTQLNLSENGLSGQIPAELGNLSNLYWLTLLENQLSGPVPPELGDLSNLEGMFLSQNQLSGPLPPELGNLSDLGSLHLSGNQLTGQIPSEFGDLSRLNSLDLKDNQLTGEIPSELGDLSNLKSLYLENNLLSGQIPSELGGLLRLELLHLGGNQLTGEIPSELGDLFRLRSLHLSGNRLDGDIPQELGDLFRLRSLHLSENLLTGEFPASFVGMPLWRLDFYNNQTLCVPVADEFQSWLNGINTVRGSSCAPVDSREDRAVLALLYSATNGENWKDNYNWLSGRPIREWYGVTNDADGRVTGLYLSDNQMSGSIPPEIGDLSQLQWLYLQQNELTGQVPRSFLNLANLTSFYFSDNAGLCAPVDKEFQTWLQGMREAEGGSCNPVADLNVLAMLYNATDGENWKVNSNWLSDLPMREWYGVETDEEGHVTALDLHWNWLSGTIPKELGDLSNMEELDLTDNQLSGTIPMELGSLPNLTKLYLSYNQLTGEIPPELGNLSNLEELELWGNELTGTIPRELGSLANLTSLHLGNNQLTGEIPPELGDLSNLEELELWRNELTSTIPRELGSLGNLTSLYLSNNQLTGEIPPELGNLSNLEELGLRDNMLTGQIPTQLGNLSSLEYLGLRDNMLTGEIPTVLGDLSNLEYLDLRDNQLTGQIPRSFTGLTRLTRLEFWNNAGLCAPNDEVFQAWLQDIVIVYGEACDFAPDRDVLVGLYNAMDGDNWDESGNWLTDRPMGEWSGVGTDNSGRVTWLGLGNNQLTGEIPPELDNLSNLIWLELDHNQLTGEIPPELGNLSNLAGLDLSHNQLTGTTPTQLGNLSDLSQLHLDHNQLTGTIPTQLGNLTNLTWLHLDHNQLSGTIPTQLGNLTNLKVLSLRSNQLTGTIPDELGNLTNLILLYFGSNQLSGTIPSQLGNLTDLAVLSLSDNHLTGEVPDSLTGLTQLEALFYHGNIGLCAPVSDSFQTWLQSVVTVTGSSCAPVDSQEDRTVLAKFYDATDGANWKDSSNWLSDRPIREWHGVTNDANGRVTGLYLGENGLSGPIPPELGDLSNLRRLALQENQLSGSIPPELGNLSVLVSLSLHSNQLTGSIPPELGNLSVLVSLSLHSNQLTGSIPPELGNLSNLIGLYLRDNQITGCIPASLDRLFFFFNDLHLLGLPTCGIPTVTMSVDSASYQVRIDSPIPVTATFSEPVEDFTDSDVTVANGGVSSFVGSDGDSVYTFDVTPNAVGVVTMDIIAGVAESYEGNGNTAAVQLILGLPYDDDHDGAIGPTEILEAVADYFSVRLSAQHVLELIRLYFQLSP